MPMTLLRPKLARRAALALFTALALTCGASAQQTDPTGGGAALKSIDPETGKASPAINPEPGKSGTVEHRSAQPGEPNPPHTESSTQDASPGGR